MREDVGDWTFDVPTGTWRSAKVSADILERAMFKAGIDQLWTATPARPFRGRLPEFGRAVRSPSSYGDLVPALARCVARVRYWVELPHIRRNDASVYLCSCGIELPIPSDFGRDQPHREHRLLYPGHTFTFAARPGPVFAWYGVAAGAPEKLPFAPLEELQPIPEDK